MTWAAQARGAVARPCVCPARGTTHSCTVVGDAAWNQRAAIGSSGLAAPAMISTGRGLRPGWSRRCSSDAGHR
jgi:hypothetical protein